MNKFHIHVEWQKSREREKESEQHGKIREKITQVE